jgi:KaiC/GvpD/RAD55 family RecA-like ATPase
MTIDIKKELDENKTALLLMPSTEYNSDIIDIVKQLSEKKVCYITLNKTFDSLMEIFKKKGVNTENLVFIDAISKTIKKTTEVDNCFFVSSPGALTELSLVISKFLKQEFDYLIFDSLTNLMIYEKKAPVAKFLSSLINKISATETKSVFYAISVKEQDELIKQCSMFVDRVIDLGNE